MLKLVILGLPRSATTRVYKELCLEAKRRWRALCIFEPTNFEVVDQIFHGIKHVHDVVGDVPYDYDKLPRELFYAIRENAKWHYEWITKESVTKPFCGEQIFDILDELDRLPYPIVLKDVHLWVYAPAVAARYPRAEIIFTLRHFEAWFNSIKKRLKLVPIPWDKAGIGKFYRFFTNGGYLKEVNESTLFREAKYVYDKYLDILERTKSVRDVYIVRFFDQLQTIQIKALIDAVMS